MQIIIVIVSITEKQKKIFSLLVVKRQLQWKIQKKEDPIVQLEEILKNKTVAQVILREWKR